MVSKISNRAGAASRDEDYKNITGKLQFGSSALCRLGTPSGLGTIRALEPRILLDAAALATGAEAVDNQAAIDAQNWQQSQIDSEGATNGAAPVAPVSTETELLAGGIDPSTNGLQEIAFVDASVEDMQAILDSLGPNVEVVIIDANTNGVEQIASVLADRQNIDAIHIISHGRSGTLDLGTTKLTEISMADKYADEMAVIKDSLSEDADILIYGCDFAAGTRGVNAVDALAEATGADVAASNDLTGAADLGGDWDLEVQSGSIETTAIAATAFSGILADGDTDGDGIHDADDLDDDNDGILDADESDGFVFTNEFGGTFGTLPTAAHRD
ncbi:MAG: DUF4347 domain-containing protein, partial [Rhizobiaceae bacterium]|nr:DUF4347 domain-containing protein [Rhizobiaceae bacterium]